METEDRQDRQVEGRTRRQTYAASEGPLQKTMIPVTPPAPAPAPPARKTSAPLEGVDEGGLPDVGVPNDPDGDCGLEVEAAAVVLQHAHERLRPHRTRSVEHPVGGLVGRTLV